MPGFAESAGDVGSLALSPIKRVEAVFAGAGATIEALSPLKGPASPTLLPNAVGMAVNAIGRTGLDLVRPQKDALDPWLAQIQAGVVQNGRFAKYQVLYAPIAPPSVVFEYACQTCRFFTGQQGQAAQPGQQGQQGPTNTCGLVQGYIARGGWCVLWAPIKGEQPFSWAGTFAQHAALYLKEAPDSLRYWLFEPDKTQPPAQELAQEAAQGVSPSSWAQSEPPRHIRMPGQAMPAAQITQITQITPVVTPESAPANTITDAYGNAVIRGVTVQAAQRPPSSDPTLRRESVRPRVPSIQITTPVEIPLLTGENGPTQTGSVPIKEVRF